MDKVNGYGIGDVNFTTMMDTLDKTRIGLHKVSLTNYDNTSAPAIAAGSAIEVNGALFYVTTEESITGSPSDGVVYIKIVPDGDEATAEFTNTAPVWDSEKQGWYSPTGGEENYRYLEFGMAKAGAVYSPKFSFVSRDLEIASPNMVVLTGAGNWSPPAGVKKFKLTMCGGGGGGGGAVNTSWGGGGGGGGIYIGVEIVSSPTYAYSVGAGGTVSADADGGTGGNTTFGTRTAYGGVGGTRRNGAEGAGGAGTYYGGPGGRGTGRPSVANVGCFGGAGGSSISPGGHINLLLTDATVAGFPGVFPGGGGGGGASYNNTATCAGGAGAAGTIIIEY